MDFEFDPAKSAANLLKHGIDFEQAREIWNDDNRVELMLESDEEPRNLMVGMIGEKHWTAIITYRLDRVRIISVRRARDVEVASYEG
jgi:uncharacterized DUF497 family protein